jgi:hypothetical protein
VKSNYDGIVALVNELAEQDSLKNDYTPMSSQLEMTEDGKSISIGGIGQYEATPLFHGQVADRLNIPKKYYDMIGTVPGLRAKNVNSLFNHKNERRMVRTLDSRARAFLSDRYRPIDHLFVFTPFMKALKSYSEKSDGEFSVKSTALSPSRMYVEIMFPNITGEVISTGRGKEVVNAGIALTNSEVGLGAFDVRSFIWWQWCKNGAIAESHIRKYHTGRRVGGDGEDYNIYSDETIQKEMDAFQARLGDIFTHALTDDSFQEVVRKIQATTDDKIEKPNTVIKNVTKRFGLTDDQGESILANMVDEKNLNRYGLMNGITRLAQEVENVDSGYELEKLGHEIITLKPSEWKVLNEEDSE